MTRTIGFKIEDSELASLNQKLSSLGYESIGPFIRDFARGLIPNDVLVEELAKAIAERLRPKVNERLTISENYGAETIAIMKESMIRAPAPPPHEGSRTSLI